MVLRRNNSQNAGCMRRSPASHCCQVRHVVCTAALALVGWPADRIAAHLSACYGERYYVEGGKLYRASKLPPYQPHLIRGEK